MFFIPRRCELVLRQSHNPRKPIEPSIEAQDSTHIVGLHRSKMNRVPRGEALVAEHDLLGPLDCWPVHGEHLIDYSKQRIERRLDRIRPVDCHIPMKYLLQDL